MVRGNQLQDNGINGMMVRGGVLSTQSIWDDTDIVHVVESEIISPNQHSYGGLRLQSSDDASLVVKFLGADAGLTADGQPFEMTDRIGGSIQIVGQPGYPVVLTSLNDDSAGAGTDLSGRPQNDTNGDATVLNNVLTVSQGLTPQPGDWRSVLLDTYSNDRNVAIVNEAEPPTGVSVNMDGITSQAQNLGQLATSVTTGDNSLRLGFEVHGGINYDMPSDVDVYSFKGTPGTQVWINLERTSTSLDSVLELVDANGNVIARSNNKSQEKTNQSLLAANGLSPTPLIGEVLQRDLWNTDDSYSSNPSDPGMFVVLPGPAGQVLPYYVRVYTRLNIANFATASIQGISATTVPNVAKLDGETFKLDGQKFEFINAAGSTVLTAGNVAVVFNTSVASQSTVDWIRYQMVQAIDSVVATLGITAQVTADGSIELLSAGIVTVNVSKTPFVGSWNLNGKTFEVANSDNLTINNIDLDHIVNSAARPTWPFSTARRSRLPMPRARR